MKIRIAVTLVVLGLLYTCMYVASKNASSENLETIRFLTNRFGRTQHRLLPQHQISISVYGKREKSTNWQIDNVISSSYNIVDDRSTSVCSFSITARESGCPNWWTSALDMSVPDISILYTPSCNQQSSVAMTLTVVSLDASPRLFHYPGKSSL